MVMKMRLNDFTKGIKRLATVLFLIPSPAVEEATSLGKKSTSHGIGK